MPGSGVTIPSIVARLILGFQNVQLTRSFSSLNGLLKRDSVFEIFVDDLRGM